MIPGTGPDRVIAAAFDTLRQSRDILLDPTPRNIDSCRAAISQCVQKIVDLMQGDSSVWNRDELRHSLFAVRRELGAVSNLLDSAAVFRRDMLKAVSGATRSRAIDINTAAPQTVARVHVLG
jgi:hypothetical protein